MGLMDVTSGKIQVPLVAIIGYASFVVVASLLVGILPALVNLPECKDDGGQFAQAVYKTWQEEKGIDTFADKLQHGHPAKRFAEPEVPKEVSNLLNKQLLREKSKKRSKEIASRAELDAAFGKSSARALPSCAELSDPNQQSYPWSSYRLPGDLAPTAYDITLNIAGFDEASKSYTGRSVITMNVVRATQFLMLSARFDSINDIDFVSLKDRNNAALTAECAFITNEYYVIKTSAQVTPAQGSCRFSRVLYAPISIDTNFLSRFQAH